MGLKWVWCGICAKYLTFGTYPTSTMGALTQLSKKWEISDGMETKPNRCFVFVGSPILSLE